MHNLPPFLETFAKQDDEDGFVATQRAYADLLAAAAANSGHLTDNQITELRELCAADRLDLTYLDVLDDYRALLRVKQWDVHGDSVNSLDVAEAVKLSNPRAFR